MSYRGSTGHHSADTPQLTLECARGGGGVVVRGVGATRRLGGVGTHGAGRVRLVPGGGRVGGGGKVCWGGRFLVAVVKVVHSGNHREIRQSGEDVKLNISASMAGGLKEKYVSDAHIVLCLKL